MWLSTWAVGSPAWVQILALHCEPYDFHVGILTPGPATVTVFGYRDFKDKIKLKCGH